MIHSYGKRAEDIVQGMLRHSGGRSGQRMETPLNTLVEDCVRLAETNPQVKDMTQPIAFKCEYDAELGNVLVRPSEIHRVLLNLLDNAIYAVHARAQTQDPSFVAEIRVRTICRGESCSVIVEDTGEGFSPEVGERLFEPFFTTKPTGTGTGLGLSLSYDNIVSGHGGQLTARSVEGKGASFEVVLPLR